MYNYTKKFFKKSVDIKLVLWYYNIRKKQENKTREVNKMNTIYTDKEYMNQGFSKEECPLIREHDLLVNRFETLTVEERERLMNLSSILKL